MQGTYQDPVGPTYVFKNITAKRISSGQNGIPILDPGEEFSLQESQLRAIHLALVTDGMLSVNPALPPDLDERSRSLNWRDAEFRKLMAMAKEGETQIVFAADAPATGVVGETTEIAIQVQDAAGVVNQTDSDEEVDITVAGDDIETEVESETIITVPSGSAGPFAQTLAHSPVKSGTLVITAGLVVGYDDGEGNITGTGISAGAINYETGAITGLTYDAPVAGETVITADYTYVTETEVEDEAVATVPGGGSAGPFAKTLERIPVKPGSLTITADTIVGTDDGEGNITGTGISAGAINYETGAITGLTYDAPVAGETVITADYTYVTETEVEDETVETVSVGGSAGPFAATLAHFPVVAGTLTITADTIVGTDDGEGNITGTGISAGAINYETGEITGLTYDAPVVGATIITAEYSYVSVEGVVGTIEAVTGYVETPGANSVRAKFSSGIITIQVTSASAGLQTLTLANPKTDALDVSDTHQITWS